MGISNPIEMNKVLMQADDTHSSVLATVLWFGRSIPLMVNVTKEAPCTINKVLAPLIIHTYALVPEFLYSFSDLRTLLCMVESLSLLYIPDLTCIGKMTIRLSMRLPRSLIVLLDLIKIVICI